MIRAQRLARLGASTLAIDASAENVQTATLHASQDPYLLRLLESGQLEYRASAAENLIESPSSSAQNHMADTAGAAKQEQFDVVCAMEVLEHVSDPPGFLRCLADLTKVGCAINDAPILYFSRLISTFGAPIVFSQKKFTLSTARRPPHNFHNRTHPSSPPSCYSTRRIPSSAISSERVTHLLQVYPAF